MDGQSGAAGYPAQDRTLVVNETKCRDGPEDLPALPGARVCTPRPRSSRPPGPGQQISPVRQRQNLGGGAFTRGRIYHLLSNQVDVGEIRHKTRTYPGQHPATINRVTFEAINLRLKANPSQVKAQTSAFNPLPLGLGRFTDEIAARLTLSHVVMRNKRCCYGKVLHKAKIE
jgi:site-specific DNA recombinase